MAGNWMWVDDDAGGSHLPDFGRDASDLGMLGSGLRHIGIVSPEGETVITVWNHHHYHAALDLANRVVTLLREPTDDVKAELKAAVKGWDSEEWPEAYWDLLAAVVSRPRAEPERSEAPRG